MPKVSHQAASNPSPTVWYKIGWPLFFAGIPFGGWSIPGLLLLMVDWAVTGRRPRTALPRSYRYSLIGLIVVFIITSALASHRLDAFATAIGYTWTLLFGAYYAFRLARTGQASSLLSRSLWPVPIAGAAHALMGIYQYLTTHVRAAGTTINPNQYGTLMVIAAFLGVTYLLSQRSWLKWLTVPYGLVVLGGLLASGSRGSWVGAIAGLLVVGCFAVLRLYRVKGWRVAGVLVAGLTAFALVGTLTYQLASPQLQARIRSIIDISSNMDRVHLYQSMGRLIRANPWFGVGLNNLKYEFAQYRVHEKMPVHEMAHNMILQVWGDIGLFGLGFTLLLLGFWLVRGLPPGKGPWQLWWLYGLLVALLVRDQFDGALTILVLAFFLNWLGATLAGLTMRAREGDQDSPTKQPTGY